MRCRLPGDRDSVWHFEGELRIGYARALLPVQLSHQLSAPRSERYRPRIDVAEAGRGEATLEHRSGLRIVAVGLHPWAMADYFTNPEHARDLVKHLLLPSGKLPPVYQVAIRAEFTSQTPVKVAYVAHRTLD